MAEFKITTTGTLSPVEFPDVGSREFIHPTVSLDMIATEGFLLEELLASNDIAASIDAGHITVEDAQGNPITNSISLPAAASPHNLGSHEDIDLSGLSNGDVLEYNSTTQKWERTASAGGGGISEAQHEDLDTLTHWLSEDMYEEFTFSGNKLTTLIVWTDNTKVKKIREFSYIYTGFKVNIETIKQYDATGALKTTLTGTYTWSGNKVSHIDWVEA